MKTRILIGLAAIFLATTATAAPWGGERCQNVRAKNLDACMKMVAAFNRVDAWLQQFTKGGFDGAETDIEVQVAARQGFLGRP